MKWFKNNIGILAAMALLATTACQPKELELTDSDIVWETSEITSFTPASGMVGSEVTINGVRMDDAKLEIYYGAQKCKIISQSATSAVVQLPRVINPDYFKTVNVLQATSTSADKFTPVYPESVITESSINDSLFKSANYVIKGQNLDLVTKVIFKDTVINIDGTTVTDPTTLTIVVKEANPLKPKFKAIEAVSFECKAGNTLPQKSGIMVFETHPSANLVVVDPKVALKGDTVKFIFDDYKSAQIISQIKVGTKVAAFTFSEPYVNVIIPSDAANGAIEIKNQYGVLVKYADKAKLTLN